MIALYFGAVGRVGADRPAPAPRRARLVAAVRRRGQPAVAFARDATDRPAGQPRCRQGTGCGPRRRGGRPAACGGPRGRRRLRRHGRCRPRAGRRRDRRRGRRARRLWRRRDGAPRRRPVRRDRAAAGHRRGRHRQRHRPAAGAARARRRRGGRASSTPAGAAPSTPGGRWTSTGMVRWCVGVLGAGFDSVVNERANRWRWPRGQAALHPGRARASCRCSARSPYVLELDGRRVHDPRHARGRRQRPVLRRRDAGLPGRRPWTTGCSTSSSCGTSRSPRSCGSSRGCSPAPTCGTPRCRCCAGDGCGSRRPASSPTPTASGSGRCR